MSAVPERFKNRETAGRLKELEKVVRDRMSYVHEVADALREINESKLYRLDYETFDDYTKAVFGFGRSYAYRLIASTKIPDKVCLNLSTQVDTKLPAREEIISSTSQVAETDSEPEESETASDAVIDSEEVAEIAASQEAVQYVTDAEGHPVPEDITKAFLELDEFKELDSLCQKLQAGIDAVSRTHAGFQLRRQLQSTGTEEKRINKSEHLNALKRDLKFTRPHSVCPYCAGKSHKEVEDCKGCNGAGWVTSITYKSAPDELKARMACSI